MMCVVVVCGVSCECVCGVCVCVVRGSVVDTLQHADVHGVVGSLWDYSA